MVPQPKLASFILRKIRTTKNRRYLGTSGDLEKSENWDSINNYLSVGIFRSYKVSFLKQEINARLEIKPSDWLRMVTWPRSANNYFSIPALRKFVLNFFLFFFSFRNFLWLWWPCIPIPGQPWLNKKNFTIYSQRQQFLNISQQIPETVNRTRYTCYRVSL